MDSKKLLCTFTEKDLLGDIIQTIFTEYNTLYNKIFVFSESASDSNDLYVTYNINGSENKLLQNTVLIHRKKDTNTLYTINSLNAMIMELNNGILDKNYKLNWMLYRNTLLLLNNTDLKKIHLTIHTIYEK